MQPTSIAPVTSAPTDPGEPDAPVLEGFDVVIPSWLRWDGVELIMHKTARHLAGAGNRVLFCEPPYALSTIFLHPEHAERIKADVRRWWGGTRRVAPDLYVWTPPPVLFQMGLHRLNDWANHRMLRRGMARALQSLGMRRPIVWSYHPFYLDDERFLSPRLVVFDCNDRIAAFEPRQEKRRLLDPMESSLLARADLVYVTARTLEEDLGAQRPDLVYLPSGVDSVVVDRVALGEVAEDLAAIPGPRIGYLGAVDSRLDWDLLGRVADHAPGWNLVFVGPELEPTPPGFRERANVHFLGGRAIDELADYLAGFDVALIPFRPADFVRYMFPTKTYEYFAAGKPVVTTDIPALRDLMPLVRVAQDAPEFIAAIEEALADADGEVASDLAERRRAEARGNTWDMRFARSDGLCAARLCGGGREPDGIPDPLELEAAELADRGTGVPTMEVDRWGQPDPKRITVLFLPTNLRIGGAERQLVDLARGLDRTRFRPLVACFREVGPFFDELVEAGIPARFFDLRPYWDFRALKAIWRVARLLRREKVDIIQTYEFNTKFVGWMAARLAGTPVVVSAEHATGEVGDTPAKNWILRHLQVLCDRFIYVAEAQRRFYEEERGLSPGRSRVIYNGIDVERFRPGRVEPIPRAELGLPEGAPIIGITAVLRREKEHPVLFRAFRLLSERVPTVHLLVVGDGEERERLEALAAELGIAARVHFSGFRTDVERLVPLFDVMVLCSGHVVETFPLSLLEAMCAGKPVVSTRVSGVPEIVDEGETGHLVPVGDSAALADRIAGLLEDPERARAFGAAGRAKVIGGLTTEIMVEGYEAAYVEELQRWGRRDIGKNPERAGEGPDRSGERVDVLGIGVDPFPRPEMIARVVEMARGGGRHLVLYSNVHVVDQVRRHRDLAHIVNGADLVYVDGTGIRLGARLLGRWLPERMTGADWIHDLCARAEADGIKLYFLAGRDGVAQRASQELLARHPDLQVVGTHHGYLGEQSASEDALADIARTRPDIVLVGMGTPTQERWIAEHRSAIEAPVVWGVGALFDFVTGEVRRGPRWMLDHHLEWLARFVLEPRRLWHRYLIGNSRFLVRILIERFQNRPR